jgi:AcrR family transcriptional regulator
MPYPAEHKAEVRRRIVQSARVLFNRHGFEAVTIDEVMQDAGLTRGGFYNHFRSKGELYGEALAMIMEDHPAHGWPEFDFNLSPEKAARSIATAYLSEAHAAEIDHSCPLVTQASEAARGEPEVRSAYNRVLQSLIDVLQGSLGPQAAPKDALAMAALCVGGLTLARATDDPALRGDILAASQELALRIVDEAGRPPRAEAA